MAMSDPVTLTIDATPYTLNRVKGGSQSSEFSDADESYKLSISHQDGKGRTRRLVRVDARIVAADPLTAVNEYKNLGVYLVVDEPEFGFTDATIANIITGFKNLIDATFVTKFLSGQF